MHCVRPLFSNFWYVVLHAVDSESARSTEKAMREEEETDCKYIDRCRIEPIHY